MKIKSKPVYVDASSFTVINRAVVQEGLGYSRLDSSKYGELTGQIKRYMGYSTGLAVLFRTDSNNISARWTTKSKIPGVNTTIILQSGLDLYIKKDGHWTFAGVGKPSLEYSHTADLVKSMAAGVKECMLYLPMFNSVSHLEIGIDEDAVVESLPNPFSHKVAVIGSSITHGASASRPGMAYPARLERMMNLEFCNLGFSGQCKLNEFYADIAAASDADAFLFDTFSNPSSELIEQRLKTFVDIIRKAHPRKPLIFLQTEIRETTTFDEKTYEYERKKRKMAEREIEKLREDGYTDIYFINPGMVIGDDHEGTADGVHPNDLGFERMIEHLLPELREILAKYEIE